MILLELVEYLKSRDRAERLGAEEMPNVDFDLIELFMVGNLAFESEIRFFNTDETPGTLLMEINGIKYVNLFPLNLAQELVGQFLRVLDEGHSNLDLAKRLLEYRINDA